MENGTYKVTTVSNEFSIYDTLNGKIFDIIIFNINKEMHFKQNCDAKKNVIITIIRVGGSDNL